MAHELTTNYKDFDHKRLDFSEWDGNNDRSKGQQICYPRYEHPTKGSDGPLFLQLPWMTIFKGGVPPIHPDYAPTDKDRAHLKMPFDLSDANVKKVYDEMCQFDQKMTSKAMKERLFEKKAKKFNYIQSCKLPDEDDEETPPMMKLKIHLSWPDFDNVETEVYRSEQVDGSTKRKRTRLEVSSVTEFAQECSYLSRVRLIIKPVKLWAQSANLKDPNYGVTWRICKVEVEPKANSQSLNQYKNNDAFIDSDAEDEEQMNAQESESNDASDNDSEESEEEEEDSDDSEEDAAPPSPVMKKKTKGSKSKTKNS